MLSALMSFSCHGTADAYTTHLPPYDLMGSLVGWFFSHDVWPISPRTLSEKKHLTATKATFIPTSWIERVLRCTICFVDRDGSRKYGPWDPWDDPLLLAILKSFWTSNTASIPQRRPHVASDGRTRGPGSLRHMTAGLTGFCT